MSNSTIYKNLQQLGDNVALPQTPEEAILEKVPNPQNDIAYCVRFTAPEFTSLCPITNQPDFALLLLIMFLINGWLRVNH